MSKLVLKNQLPSAEEFQKLLAQAMTETNPVDDLLELSYTLRDYEQKYQLSSLDFYEKYQAGLLDDELQHCLQWAVTYEFFLKTNPTEIQNHPKVGSTVFIPFV